MAVLTAIELGPKRLSAATVRANGHAAEILKGGSVDLAEWEPDRIRRALEECGVSDVRAILVVPRGQALVREFDLPESTPDELVPMVRFQVEREMPLPVDQIRYSYMELGREGGKVRVLVTAVPKDVLDAATSALDGAGVKVSGIYISSFGLLSLYGNGDRVALVEVGGREAEILVVDRGRMEFSRTAGLSDGVSAGALAEEIERTLLTWSARAPGKPVQKVVLAGEGPAAGELAQGLRERLSQEVAQVGPGGLDTAAVAGICVAVSRGAALPDILKPPVVVKRFRPTRIHRMAALAVLGAAALFAWAQIALSSKGTLLQKKHKELADLEPQAAAVNRMNEQTALAHQWYRHRYPWIRTFDAMRQPINRGNLWIVTATFEDTGILRIYGKARAQEHVGEFVAALTKMAPFKEVVQDKMTMNQDKGEYRQDFWLTVQLAGFDSRKKK